ncbi:hypothetical protein N0V94_000368 [Neodidymelliopsis sp. IMI 364377]|nr:hypothetical protein N0V94_000368 [Neodidymelliopsis sp. IMI 364377]
MDLLDEDLMRNEETRATGFIGKASEIQWLRKLHAHGSAKTSEGGPWGPPGDGNEAIDGRLAALRKRQHNHPSPLMERNRASFYLDDEIFETDLMVDPFELPPFDVAERLMQAYMESVHNSFPFLQKKAFVNYFYQYYASLQHVLLYQLGPWWQMVHVVMQALVVLLLEIVYEDMHFPEDRQEVVPSLKKLLRWLRVMRVNN